MEIPGSLHYLKNRQSETEDDFDEENTCRIEWLDMVEDGGFTEGVIRIMVAMAHTDVILNRRVLKTYRQIAEADERIKKLNAADFTQMIRQQACILHADQDKALNALAKLIPDKKDRAAALKIAEQVAVADQSLQ